MKSTEATETHFSLYFKIDGEALQDGLDVHVTVSALREMQYVLDRSYLALSEGKHLRRLDREAYQLVADNVQLGSLDLALRIILDTAIPVVAYFGPGQIWELAKSAFDLLQFLYSLRNNVGNKEQPISIKVNGDGNTIVIVHGDASYTTDKVTFELARQIRPSVREIARLTQSEGLDYFQISSGKEAGGIRVDKANAKQFSASTKILSTPIEAECEILSFNKKSSRGRLRVFSSQALPLGEYPFVVKGKDRDGFLQGLGLERVTLRVRQEIAFDPFEPQTTKIVRLHLLSAND